MNSTSLATSMVDLLPSSLKEDPVALAQAQLMDERFSRMEALTPYLAPRAHIDKLTEPWLSYLAWENDVDLWDQDWPVAKKREVVKHAEMIQRKKGTKFAVCKGLETMGFRVRHVNWPEFGGAPATFRMEVDVLDQGLNEETYSLVRKSIHNNKAGRSHLDRLDVYLSSDGQSPVTVSALTGLSIDVFPWIPEEQDIEVPCRVGVGAAMYTIIDIEQQGADI
ncbi:MAG: phage tail protein I [Desulfovibrio sp.]